jgi:hypothetical protein
MQRLCANAGLFVTLCSVFIASGCDPPQQWCFDGGQLAVGNDDSPSCNTPPDILVDVRAAANCESFDADALGSGKTATCSLTSALEHVELYGDPSPGDGMIVIGVVGRDAASGTADCTTTDQQSNTSVNVIIQNIHKEHLWLVGCGVALTPADARRPIISLHHNKGSVTVEQLILKHNPAPGIDIENNAAPVTIRGVSFVQNEPGLRIQTIGMKSPPIYIERSVFERNRTGGLTVEVAGDAALELNVEQNHFRDNHGGAIAMRASNEISDSATVATLRTSVRNNDLTNAAADVLPPGNAVDLAIDRGARMIATMENNLIRNHTGDGISVAGEGNLSMDIGATDANRGNTISGTTLGDGIDLVMDEKGGSYTWTVRIQNNRIGGIDDSAGDMRQGLADDGIQIQHRDGSGTLDLTIDNNRIANTGSEGIRFFSDEDLSGGSHRPGNRIRITDNTLSEVAASKSKFIRTRDSADACAHISNNVFSNHGEVFLDQGGASILSTTHADTASLAADNGGIKVRSEGAIATGKPCPVDVP